MTLEEFANRAMPVPFKDRGRGWDGWDCWGLLCMAFREINGVILPSFAEEYADSAKTRAGRLSIDDVGKRYLTDQKMVPWRPVDVPRRGDVPVFNIEGLPVHVGLMIDGNRFLHADRKIGTRVEDLTSLYWKDRLATVYRYGR